MEKFDVIIIGMGIAGSSLLYQLSKQGYEGKVLIIDKETQEKQKLSYRITFEDTVRKYSLPFKKVYDSLSFHINENDSIPVFEKSFLLDYNSLCKFFIKNSIFESRIETAINVDGNILITNKNQYSYKFLIDASGNSFFLKKILKMKLPEKYWVGKSIIYQLLEKSKDKSFHYFFNPDGFFEDIYSVDDKLMYGVWKYTSKNDIQNLNYSGNNRAREMIKGFKKIKEFYNIVPCSPSLPIVKDNIAFIGDCFGNATTASAEGIKPIIDSSEILAKAISVEDLDYYANQWKKTYLESYIKFLAFKKIRYPESEFFKKVKKMIFPSNMKIYEFLKDNPNVLYKMLRNDESYFKEKNNSSFIVKLIFLSLFIQNKFKYQSL